MSVKDAVYHYNRGVALQQEWQFDAALASYDRAIRTGDRLVRARAYANRAVVLMELGELKLALSSYGRALAIEPDAWTYCNRAQALRELKRFDEALEDIEKAVALKADWPMFHYARGALLDDLGRSDEAIAHFDRAITLDPECAMAHGAAYRLKLLVGDFARGWREREWCRRHDAVKHGSQFTQPLWLGDEPLNGKTILLCSDPVGRGLGDIVQFCRFASKVAALGARVILHVPEPLKNLLADLEGVSEFVVEGETLPEFDCWCPLLSLPLAFKTTIATIPVQIPYLKVDACKLLSWKEKLGERSKLRVGLVWAAGCVRPGAPTPPAWAADPKRNIPLSQLLGALDHPRIDFYNLQKGEPAESELAAYKAQGCGPQIIEHPQDDFYDTAALIEQLDLVISVDTSVAHVAGALGKQTWLLLPFNANWRWLMNRSDSPWYPTFTLYRQERFGDWTTPLKRISAGLSGFQRRSQPVARSWRDIGSEPNRAMTGRTRNILLLDG